MYHKTLCTEVQFKELSDSEYNEYYFIVNWNANPYLDKDEQYGWDLLKYTWCSEDLHRQWVINYNKL